MSQLFDTLITPYLNLDLELNSVDLLNPGVSSVESSRVGNAHLARENNSQVTVEINNDESETSNPRDNNFQQNSLITNFDAIFLDTESAPNLALSRAASFRNRFRDFPQYFTAKLPSYLGEPLVAEEFVNRYVELFFVPKDTKLTIPEPTVSEPETIVFTDKNDYSPGETATIFGENFDIGETIRLQVLHNDGTPNTGGGHQPWFVTDGGAGDLDGVADGNFRTIWYVNPDDSLNSTFELTAIGQSSQEIVTHTFTDSDPAVQFFYVPLDDDDIKIALDVLESDTTVNSNLDSSISVTVSTNNTIIYYDHWEDGYETDINNPTQSSTEIWGDNDPSNGIPPGFTTDVLDAGEIIILRNTIATTPRDSNAIFFDGRDKLGASKAIVVTRQLWSESPGTVLAGAVEVLDTSRWGNNFVVPVGENTSSDSIFEYTSLFITATENGTNITITGVDTDNDNVYDDTINETLNEGEIYFVDGGVGAGATVNSSTKNIQAHLVTGHVGANWESRWYTLIPRDDWSNTYYSPVGTVSASNPVDIFLYNPNGTEITVTTSENTTNSSGGDSRTSFPISANSVVRRRLVDSSAVSFTTGGGGSDFFALAAVDADLNNNANHDWGFSLVPDTSLTPIVQIGLGIGSDDLGNDGIPDQNGSPLWVTTTAATTIYVDYDGDGVGNNTDINGGQYDESFVLGELESIRILDTLNNDNDQTGIKVYTLDGTDIIAAWGQDPSTSDVGSPYLDLGTTVLPLPLSSAWKISTITDDGGNNLGNSGETIQYKINVQNDGVILLGNVNVSDIIPDGTTYVPGSTTVDYIDGKVESGTITSTVSIADDTTGTVFPLDDDATANGFDAGLNIGNIDAGESAIVTFEVTINSPFNGDTSGFITNSATVDSDEETFTITVQTPVDPTIITTPTIQTKSLYLSDDSGSGGSSTDLDRIVPDAATPTESSVLLYNPLVGVDFDPGSNSPSNWLTAGYGDTTLTGLTDESGSSSSYQLTLDFLSSGSTNIAVPITSNIPSHSNSLTGIDDDVFDRSGLTATWSGLDPLTDYNVYVFGLLSIGYNQDVTITGSSVTSFNQSASAAQLTVNDSTGSSASSLESFGELVTSDVSGNITVQIDGNQVYYGTYPYIGVAGLAIEPVITNAATTNFNQSISMTDDFVVKSGNLVEVTAYLDITNGAIDTSTPANNDIKAILTYDSGNIATISNPTSVTFQSGNIYEVTWQTTLAADVTIASGEDVNLEIINGKNGLGFKVLYDSTNRSSQINFPTTTVIDIDSIEFYNDSSANAGNQINAAAQGDTVYVRVQVSDPFGDSDITGLVLNIDDEQGNDVVVDANVTTLVDTSVDADGNGIKIFEYAWNIAGNADLETYTITATATEGLETSPITDTDNNTFVVNANTDPDVFINDASATEGNQLVFDVTLTNTSTTDITLDLTTTPGTAREISDYEIANFEYSTDGGSTWINGGGTNGTQVTIPAGKTGIKVRIDSVSDTTDEPDETYILGIDSVVSGSVRNFSDTGIGTIVDDDGSPQIAITDVSIVEGDSDTKDVTFTITLDQTSSQTVTVDYATTDDTATIADSDYTSTSGTLSFAPGETTQTITVSITGDSNVESDETFTLDLSNAANAIIIDAQGEGTIINDDGLPSVVIGDASEVEANVLIFDVGLTSPSTEDITVTLDTASGTATDGTDYENSGFRYSTDNGQNWQSAGSNQVVIPAGSSSIKVEIGSTSDTTTEDNETFTLSATAATGASTGTAAVNQDFSDTGTGTIIDDDGIPAISINDVSLSEGDSGTTSFTFTVSLDEADTSTVTVDYNVNDGTATTADSDYTDTSGTVTFAPGETTKLITVDVTGDTPVESDETFTVDLSNPTNATIGDSQGAGTILNDDDNTGAISGTVFADIDNDNAGESPLSGVTIELLDSGRNAVDSDPNTPGTQPTITTTDALGSYSFTNVEPGDYLIKQTNLSGYADVSDNDAVDDDGGAGGTDDDTNSDTNDNLIPVSLSSQESDTGNNFIDEQTGTITGEVLADTNNDDIGDSPLENVIITLKNDLGATVATTTTDNTGKYTFSDVAPGNYTVEETNLSDYGDVSDSDGTGSNDNNTIAVSLSPGGISTGNDFVDEQGVISGTVQADTNNDDIGDTALANVTITLKNDLGGTVATTTTDNTGSYTFANIPSGTYTIEQTNLTGYNDVSEQDSIIDSGGNDTDLENSSTNNDNILDVVLVAGETDTGNDFVDEAQSLTIAGKVLEDTNGDGVGDSPLGGVLITLSGDESGTTNTASDGSYSFTVSGPGNYTLTSPASDTGTVDGYNHLNELDSITDNVTNDTDLEDNSTNNDRTLTVALVAGEADTGNDFVYEAQPGTISGTVFADDGDGMGDVGKDGVTLTLLNGDGNPVLDNIGNPVTAVTSGGGTYSFANLAPGNYQIQETDPSGYSSLSDGDSTADTIEDDATNSNTNDNIIAVTLLADETDSGNDFYDQLNGTISGQVLEDTDGDTSGNTGIGGVTVTLKDSNGDTVATTVTDSSGDYSFSDVVPGDYTVEQTDLTGYSSINDEDSTVDGTADDAPNSSTTDNILAVTLLAGETDNGNDFIDAQNASISGTVKDSNGNGLLGVTIELLNGAGESIDSDPNTSGVQPTTTTTASDGSYSFSDLTPGSYQVQETDLTSYVSLSDGDSVNDGSNDNDTNTDTNDNTLAVDLVSGESDTGNDFVDEQAGTISGTVEDNSGNPLVGVTITLKDGAGGDIDSDPDTSGTQPTTTITAGDGTYSFTGLASGNYQVQETDPTNYTSVSDGDSTTDGIDDDTANTDTNDNLLNITLLAGETDSGNDFVDQVSGSGFITGSVLEDTDGDGVGDTPLVGVTINLGGQETRSTTTDGDGNYSFGITDTALSNGNYTITQVNPNGYGDVAESDNTNDNSISVTISDDASTGNNFVDGLEASISGLVWEDLDEDGIQGQFEDVISGVTVTLTGGGADGLLSTTGDNTTDTLNTDANGSYSFTELNPGEQYQVNFPTAPSGYNGLTTQDQGSDDTIDSDANSSSGATATITLNPGEDKTNVNVGFNPSTSITVEGTDGSDSLDGADGVDDLIVGYKGQDTISGGTGSDTFFFNETSDGIDVITDFTSGTDKLDFSKIVEEIEAYNGGSDIPDPIGSGYITQQHFSGVGTMVRADFDNTGSLNPKDVVFLQGLTGTIPSTDFIL